MKFCGWIVCALAGHKRGKRISSDSPLNLMTERLYQCPRCLTHWTRKIKPESATVVPKSLRKQP